MLRFIGMIIVSVLVDLLLILGALTFKDPGPPVLIAFFLWPVILMLMVIASIKDPNERRADMIKMQNFYNIDAIRHKIDRIK
jgi:hypothetical protein